MIVSHNPGCSNILYNSKCPTKCEDLGYIVNLKLCCQVDIFFNLNTLSIMSLWSNWKCEWSLTAMLNIKFDAIKVTGILEMWAEGHMVQEVELIYVVPKHRDKRKRCLKQLLLQG